MRGACRWIGRARGFSAGVLVGCLWICPLLAHPVPPAAEVDAPSAWLPESLHRWRQELGLLHAGRAPAALSRFVALHRQSPEDACGFYFPALVYGLFELEHPDREARLEEARTMMAEGIRAGQRRIDDQPDDLTARYCLGALYGLQSQDRFRRSQYLRAALDAKRSRNLMLAILEEKPAFVDCLFWTGSYDYLADVLPRSVKFFRTLLFLPGGDRDRGIEALEEVAENGSLDRFLSYLMLHEVYGAFEQDEEKTFDLLGRFHAAFPGSEQATLGLADFLAGGTGPERARGIALQRELLARVGAREHEDTRLEEKIILGLAQAHLQDLDPGAAVELLLPALARARGRDDRELRIAIHLAAAMNRSGLHRDAEILFSERREQYAGSPLLAELEQTVLRYDEDSSRIYHELLPARRLGRDGRLQEAAAAFREARAELGDRAQIFYRVAEMYFRAERNEQATAYYRKALDVAKEKPAYVRPYSYLRLGNLQDLQNTRRAARKLYRRALENAGGIADAEAEAKQYLRTSYERPPLARLEWGSSV